MRKLTKTKYPSIRAYKYLLFCLFASFSTFASEPEDLLPSYYCSSNEDDEPSLFVPDQLATLTSEANQLIGGIISPLSGNPCLREIDFTVVGAQEIAISRTYIAPHLPGFFHKHSDANNYYRVNYLKRHYEGWKHFPHLRLWINPRKNEVHLVNPNAAAYNFSVVGGKTTLLQSYAANNLGADEIPSGQCDPKNIRVTYNDSSAVVFSPDGSTRYYSQKRGSGVAFLLEKEVLPNGKVLKYHYSNTAQLTLLESLDPKEQHVYASVRIQGAPKEGLCNFTTSTGLSSSYIFENRTSKEHFRDGSLKIKYDCVYPPLMVAASSPQFRNETSKYIDPECLLQSFSGKQEIFALNYIPVGTGNKTSFRVDKLLFPVGSNDTFISLYEMTYQPPVAGEKEGKTTVKNRDGTSVVYHFSKNLLTTSIQYFGQDGKLKKEKIFSWDEHNWLTSIEVRDENKNLFYRRSYEFDVFGNPTLESFTGDLTGDGKMESYSTKRQFSQDGRNLLLKEETEEGKVTTFEYLPNTNLITLKLVKAGERILMREQNLYDDCNNLVQRSIDDGSSQKIMIHYILRQEQPFLHLPEWIEEKYQENGIEKVLKRVHLGRDQYGNVVKEEVYDANGAYAYSIFREYNEQGDLLCETNPLGQKRIFAYDSRGRCIEATNFSQRLKEEKHYDTKGRLLESDTNGDDGITHKSSYIYDIHDYPIQKTDKYLNIFYYTRDPLTHKITRTEAPSVITNNGQIAPVVTCSAYDAIGREISRTDANGCTIFYHYNAYGSPIEISYPDGSKDTYRYFKSGKMASHVNREGLLITYTYDVLDRVTSECYETLGKKNFVYDSFHLLEERDLDGNTTHYLYDGADRKIQEEKCGRIINFAYDTLGRLSTISKESLVTHFKRDLEDRIIEESKTDAMGALLYKIECSYNEDGDTASITRFIDGKASVESFVYDSFGRKIESQDPFGYKTTTAYNEKHFNGLGQKVLQIVSIDPQGIATKETKDPFDRTTKKETVDTKGDCIACWDKIYDPNGNVTYWNEYLYEDKQFQGIQCTQFLYTCNNQIESITRAFGTSDARTTHYTYTPGGRVSTKVLPNGITLSYDYNLLGYLQRLSSSDGKIRHRFDCNKNGKLLYAIDEVEKTAIQREIDPFGNVTRELFPNHIEINKEYDAFDRPTKLFIQGHGYLTYAYSPLFLKTVSRFAADGKLQYTHKYEKYDHDGNLLAESMIYNSGQIEHKVDLKGRKAEISSPYFAQRCRYDACDNLVKCSMDNITSAYTYDGLSQLISENKETYKYDSLFNRKEKNDTHFAVNYLNELVDQTYDLNGNQIQKNGTHYLYDPLNRLIEATSDNKRLQFRYDAMGRRLTKVVMDKKSNNWEEVYRENYLYDGQHEIGSLNPNGTLKNFRVLGATFKKDFPDTVAIELNNNIFAPLSDVQGNICKLVNPLTKKVASQYHFTSFGEEKEFQKDGNPWRYAAKRYDPELHLIYYGKRYYDPELARWLTTDPIGFVDGMNLYQYAYNNPYCYYDPNGDFLLCIAIPIQVLLNPAVWKIVVDAFVVSVGSWGMYKSMQCAAEAVDSPLTLSEGGCHALIDNLLDKRDYTKAERSTKKHREENYPGGPQDLEKNPDWQETTHPGEKKIGSRTFENTKTGEKVRYDKGKPGASGHEANDHYHRYNPKAPKGKSGDNERYLDKDGNPVHKNDDASHLYPPEGTSWS